LLAWDIADGSSKQLGKLSGSINRLAVSPDGALVAAGGQDAGIAVLDAESGEAVHRFTKHDDQYVRRAPAAQFDPRLTPLVPSCR